MLDLLEKLHQLLGEAIAKFKKEEFQPGEVAWYRRNGELGGWIICYVRRKKVVYEVWSCWNRRTTCIPPERLRKYENPSGEHYEGVMSQIPKEILSKPEE